MQFLLYKFVSIRKGLFLTNSKSSIFQAAGGKNIPDVTGKSFYPNARQFSSRLSR